MFTQLDLFTLIHMWKVFPQYGPLPTMTTVGWIESPHTIINDLMALITFAALFCPSFREALVGIEVDPPSHLLG